MQNVSLKKIIIVTLAVIGALFLILVISVLAYVAIAKPFGVKIQNVPSAIIKATSGNTVSTYDHPLLTTQQEATLESLGVDTSTLPTTITATQLDCATTALGAARVKELEAGATPTINDYLKTKNCLK